MQKLLLIVLGFIPFCLSQMAAQTINSDASKISFEISNMKVNTVEGIVSNLNGDVSFDENDLSLCQFNVCVDTKTIDTGNSKRDEHLMKDDFFDAEQYPNICFESNNATKNGNAYLANGVLKLHGIEKEVAIPFEYKDNALIGTLTINRTDYGIGGKGTFMVGDEVKIQIHCALE